MRYYPEPLIPDSLEVLLLPPGDEIGHGFGYMALTQWIGEIERDIYGNKPIVDISI